jgi:hypothetical protein
MPQPKPLTAPAEIFVVTQNESEVTFSVMMETTWTVTAAVQIV